MFGGSSSSSARPSPSTGMAAPSSRAGPCQVVPVPEPSGEPSGFARSVRSSVAVAHVRPHEDEEDGRHTSGAVSSMTGRPPVRLSMGFGLGGLAGRTRPMGVRQSVLSNAMGLSGDTVPGSVKHTVCNQSSHSSTVTEPESILSSTSRGSVHSGDENNTRSSSGRDLADAMRSGKSSMRSRGGSVLSERSGRNTLRSVHSHGAVSGGAASVCREHLLGLLHALRRRAVPHCRAITKNRFFQVAMFVALMSALFLPDLWVLIDRPDNTDLDVLLTFVLVLFLTELAVQSIGLTRTYWGSFFFWMDLLGAASLLLDISYLPLASGALAGSNGSMSNNVVIMRMARVAKLGARAGRFTKLVKLLRFLPGIREKGADLGTAKIISNRLTTLLSTRVSCLIIVMVMIMPLFSIWTYPEQDWSMTAWLDILEGLRALEDRQFEEQLGQFRDFYADLGYYPYRLEAKSRSLLSNTTALLLPWVSSRGPPKRAANSVRYQTASLVCDFSFKHPTQITSLMNVVLMVFIMLLMVGFSLVLSNSVSAIVLQPLEKLLMQVRNMASKIFQSVTSMAVMMEEEDHDAGEDSLSDADGDHGNVFGCEAALLEKVVQKLTVLSEITMNKGVLDAETMAGLGEGDRAVIHGFSGGDTSGAAMAIVKSRTVPDDIHEEDPKIEALLAAQNAMIESAGLSTDLLNSWNINPLELDRARNRAAVTYFLGPHNHGVNFDPVVMGDFLEAAEAGYIKSVPYHNWFHAVDVTHCVYRLLHLCGTEAYLTNNERYALLVSATCHDVGHPGLNNVFLIEASYELALRYNDKSPLENMHCARLFEFINMPKCNIFAGLSYQQFQEVRKCCIESILHTDNVHHFPMIKKVQMLYEVNSEVLDAARSAYSNDDMEFPSKDTVEVFRQLDQRRLLVQLLLHVADISNCSKPFRICRIWAQQVLEEFFLQGDAELKAGLPVQALNDREKVNRPFSQVGFIEFLVSPLSFAVVKVLPPTMEFAHRMVENTKTWHQCWLTESKPAPGEAERQALAERISKLEKRYQECAPP